MSVYLSAKFQTSSITLTSFRLGGVRIILPLPNSTRTSKKPTQIKVKTSVFSCCCFQVATQNLQDNLSLLSTLCMKMSYYYRFLSKFIVVNVQVFFITQPSLFCPQNQEKLINILLKHTFQKAIIYFKTSEQQLLGRNLGCYLHYFQYQIRCYGCIFKFPNTKIRESAPCVT